jgi:hypothetical protein
MRGRRRELMAEASSGGIRDDAYGNYQTCCAATGERTWGQGPSSGLRPPSPRQDGEKGETEGLFAKFA